MDKTIWHYTSAGNAVKILSSGELWAHRASQMDDKQEIVHALKQIRRFALEEVPDHLSTRAKDLIAAALDIDDPVAQQREVFVVSASLNGNSEHLWHEYAGAGGVAIEISIKERHLTERNFPDDTAVPMTGWFPVYYTDEHQGRLVESDADQIERWLKLGDMYPDHDIWSRFADLSSHQVAAYLSARVTTFKELSFEAEEEYRYVDRLGEDGECESRGSGDDCRDYTVLRPPLDPKTRQPGPIPVRSVMLASDCTPEHEAQIRAALKENDLPTVKVSRRAH